MRLALSLLAAVTLAGCTSTIEQRPLPTRTEQIRSDSMNSSTFSGQTLIAINQYRREHGLHPLRPHPYLEKLALEHSQRQSRDGKISHLDKDLRTERARQSAGMRGCGENVGVHHKSPSDVVRRWSNSPGHDRIMLWPNIQYAGVARHGPYLTFFTCG